MLLVACSDEADAVIGLDASDRKADASPGLRDASAPVRSLDASVMREASIEQPVAGSCFGRCGMPSLLLESGPCACDPGCFTRGDCCADKHELCAVSARTPLCTLTAGNAALCGADLGWSFAHDGKIELLFGDSYGSDCSDPFPNDDAQGTLPLERPAIIPAQPRAPVACGALLTIDKKRALLGGDTFAPSLLFENGSVLSSYLGETPLTGFSDGEHAYIVARRGDTIDQPIYIGVRDPTLKAPARTGYRELVKTDAPHFRNPTAVTRDGQLYLFGRGDFSGPDAQDVYLLKHSLPLAQWAPSYFIGVAGRVPQWSADVAQAKPVLERDFQRTMQFDVAWIAALDKWVMLYGGDVADWLDGEPDDQPRHGALHMRMADAPWGPWSRATPVFWREHAAPFLHCDAPQSKGGCDLDALPDDPAHSYAPGSWAPQLLDFAGCIDHDLAPSQPNFAPGSALPCLGAQRGNLYAASFIEPWTADLAGDLGYPHAATLYFLASTWMPYQVILGSLTVHLP
jgi:hypothetical protein